MRIELNVKISLYGDMKSVSVWTYPVDGLPGIDEITGIGSNIRESVGDFYDGLEWKIQKI